MATALFGACVAGSISGCNHEQAIGVVYNTPHDGRILRRKVIRHGIQMFEWQCVR